MFIRTTLAAAAAAIALIAMPGCAVTRGQETTGAYLDDSAITTAVKSKFVENKNVDASSIAVETLNGTVMLSGFAKNATEKSHRRNPDLEGQRREGGQESDRRSRLIHTSRA